MIYKVINSVDGENDPLYFEADTLAEAQEKFRDKFGDDVPDEMLGWTENVPLPEGIEPL